MANCSEIALVKYITHITKEAKQSADLYHMVELNYSKFSVQKCVTVLVIKITPFVATAYKNLYTHKLLILHFRVLFKLQFGIMIINKSP